MGGYPLKDSTKYALAAKTAKEVIDSAGFFGFNLLSNCNSLFSGNAKNNEAVFALNFINPDAYTNLDVMCYFFPSILITTYRQCPGPVRCYYPGIKFFNKYPDSFRKRAIFQTRVPRMSLTNNGQTTNIIITNVKRMTPCIRPVYKKFGVSYDFNLKGGQTLIYTSNLPWYYAIINLNGLIDPQINTSIYIFRYAQTLLTYAEAKARSGNLDASAYEAVNMIRRRAHNVDINSPSNYDLTPEFTTAQFVKLVVLERAYELCGEPEGRWFDLVRLEEVEDLPKLRDSTDQSTLPSPITKKYYFDDIPTTNLTLTHT